MAILDLELVKDRLAKEEHSRTLTADNYAIITEELIREILRLRKAEENPQPILYHRCRRNLTHRSRNVVIRPWPESSCSSCRNSEETVTFDPIEEIERLEEEVIRLKTIVCPLRE